MLLVMAVVRDPEETKPNRKRLKIRFGSPVKGRWLDPIFTLGLASLVMSFGFSLLGPIETETNQRLSQGPFLFSVEFSALIGSMAIFQPLIGKLSDIYGRRIFIIIGLICLMPFTLAQGFSTEPWHMILARGLQGLSAAMVFSPSLALAGDMADEGQSGAQLSVLTMAFGIGISLGSIFSGYAVGFGFMTPFAIGAVLAGIGVVLVATQVPKKEVASYSVRE
jgi:MFS family permease